MAEEHAAFGPMLRRCRAAAGLSQEALAERSGLSSRAVAYLEGGARSPHLATVARLANALGMDGEARIALVAAAHPPPALADSLHRITRPPLPPTPLVGRATELALLAALLRGGVRWLTLTGTGGVGKTRLGIAAAVAAAADFADGVAFVALGALRVPALVLPTVAEALGVRLGGDDALGQLAAWLAPRHLLLLVDNMEQVALAAPDLAALLDRCPRLVVLATSRAPLRVRDEREFAVRPLILPSADATVATAARVDAVLLFTQQARAIRSDFAVTPSNVAAVTAICRRLDGLPLAIELAAARTRVLHPAALLSRLDRPLDVLTGGALDLPDRQRTLRATLAWSHQLLDTAEQTLFRRLAIFAGGAEVAAIGPVCGAGAESAGDLFDWQASLVGKSLVRAEDGPDGATRITMLETVRDYALERLTEAGEDEAVARRHAVHFLALAVEAETGIKGADEAAWAARLDDERDNLRAALAWAEQHDRALGLRIAGAIYLYWDLRGMFGEGRGWLGRLLGKEPTAIPPNGIDPRVWGKALRGAGTLARMQGDYAGAGALLEACLALARASGEDQDIAYALHNLANVAFNRGDYARAIVLHQESLALKRAMGDMWGVATSLMNLGSVVHEQGDYAAARDYLEEALAMQRGGGNSGIVAFVLHMLGGGALRLGNLDRAGALLEEALALRRGLGDRQGIAFTMHGLACVANEQGDLELAVAQYLEGLEIFRETGEIVGCASSLMWLGTVAHRRGRAGRAALLLAAAAAQRRAVGAPLLSEIRPTIERYEAEVRAALGEDAYRAAWCAGEALTLDAAIAEASQEAEVP